MGTRAGTILNGTYRLLQQLGSGGMGVVYEAERVDDGRRVAIKLLHRTSVEGADELHRRFRREARLIAAIEDDHVVRVLDDDTDTVSGDPFMVMEYLTGEDLLQVLERAGPLASSVALRIVAQACLGLRTAHAAGIVHRDIKPANIFLARGGDGRLCVKLLDFGVAKLLPGVGATTGLTNSGAFLGSPMYMSPEQLRGSSRVDERTDLWALGVVLYRALAGSTPFPVARTIADLVLGVCVTGLRPLQDAAPWVSPEIAAIVHRALRIDIADRYQTVGELLADIDALLPGGREVAADEIAVISPEERARVAPRYAVPVEPELLGVRSGSGETTVLQGRALVEPTPLVGDTFDPASSGSTSPPSGSSAPQSAPRRRVEPTLLLLAVVLIGGLAGFGGYRLATRPEVELPPPSPAFVPSPPRARTVKLTVRPEGAAVEVNGVPVENRQGTVEITGDLGSVHRVRIFVGANETSDRVVIGEGGALPREIELPLPARP